MHVAPASRAARHTVELFTEAAGASTSRVGSGNVQALLSAVLVVDDNDDLRELVRFALERVGYRVLEAEDGRRALEMLRELDEEPGLVLLDLMMPTVDGIDVLRELAADHRLQAIPVVILSAATEHTAPHVPIVANLRGFYRKPVSIELLLSVVREYCGNPGA
jgi:CheY-like chemotaxis protein